MSTSFDVIVIGSGAGGGTLARRLAPSGKRILLLERGGWLPREPQNWLAHEVFVDNRYVSPDTWYDGDGRPFQPQVHYFVGGATKLYGAALYRLRREDFGELRHRDGFSPAWPIDYDEMEPYYTEAERSTRSTARAERTPPSRRPAPRTRSGAVSHEPRIQQLHDDLEAAGHHPFHAPCGVMLDERDMPHSACVRCSTCDGFPCLVHAKSDAEVLGVRPALEHSNVTLLIGAEAARLETNANGHRGHGGSSARGSETYTADIVVVSCGAANSAKLLLASASDAHPRGLANGSDQVGRNYMFHNSQAVLALSQEPNPTVFQKTLGLNDFYFGAPDADYPLGNIQMVGKSSAEMYRGEKPLQTKLAPQWTLDKVADHAVDFWLSTEDLPLAGEPRHAARRREHRARVSPDQRGAEGAAAARAQVAARADRDAPRPSGAPARVPQERHPRGRRGAPGRHLPLRQRSRRARCSTSTAARTRSTTSTSSTRASSPASAR